MLAFHAHALKSMSLNLGAKRIVELSQQLEDLGRARNVAWRPRLAPGTSNRLRPDQDPTPCPARQMTVQTLPVGIWTLDLGL